MNSAPHDDIEPAPKIDTRAFGRYLLRYRVAQGGMGSVYLAQLRSTERFHKWVAIKTIHPHIASNKKFVEMFLNEARLAARLDHPNVCTVFDFGEAGDTYYLAMEYLHGESLTAVARNAWREEGIPPELGARIIADAARGLHAAHELRTTDGKPAGVVHRDVSPQNIFVLYSGSSKVVDFGIARSDDRLGEMTASDEIKGKIAYMSPEQVSQGSVDRRTDLWALGVVLWEVTLGRRLFKRVNEAVVIGAVVNDPIPLPGEIRANYPPELEAIVMKALQRDPSNRYATALEMARDLDAFLARLGVPIGADEVGQFVRGLFAQRIAEREALLHSAAENPETEITDVDPSPSDSGSLSVKPLALARTIPRRGRPSRSRTRAIAWATAIMVVAFVATALVLSPDARRVGFQAISRTTRRAPTARHIVTQAPAELPPHEPVVVQDPPASVPSANIVAAATPLVASPTTAHDAAIATATPPPGPRENASPPTPVARRASPRASTPEPVPSEPEAVVRRVGFLNLTANLASDVFEDGRRLGGTPLLDHELPVGHHALRLVPRDGSPERTVNVDIQARQTAIVAARW